MKVIPLPYASRPNYEFRPNFMFHDGEHYCYLSNNRLRVCESGGVREEGNLGHISLYIRHRPRGLFRDIHSSRPKRFVMGEWRPMDEKWQPYLLVDGAHMDYDYSQTHLLYDWKAAQEVYASLPIPHVKFNEVGLYNKRTGETAVFSIDDTVHMVTLGLDGLTFGVMTENDLHIIDLD